MICKSYDESWLPWPIAPFYELDYCWRLTYTMWKHSLYLSLPLTFVHFIYTQMPHCWSYTRKTFPKLLFGINYCACVLLLNTINLGYSLAFEDYCNRHSSIYNTQARNSKELLALIK